MTGHTPQDENTPPSSPGAPAGTPPAAPSGAPPSAGPPVGAPPPGTRIPPESRAARSLTDRSKADDTPGERAARREAIEGPRIWPRVVGVLILLLGVGGAWLWQNPELIERATGSLFAGSATGT